MLSLLRLAARAPTRMDFNVYAYFSVCQVSLNYQQYFLQLTMQYVCDKQGEIRQAAAYGIGVMAQFGGQGYLQAYSGISVTSFCQF